MVYAERRPKPPPVLLRRCDRCGGDLVRWAGDDYLCVHCGKVFYDMALSLQGAGK